MKVAHWLEAVGLILFLVGFLHPEKYSDRISPEIWQISAAGVLAVASLFAIQYWRSKDGSGWRYLLLGRAILGLQLIAAILIFSLMIFAVAIMAMGRESLGVPAAVLFLISEIIVIVAAIRSLKRR